ncbi:PREDICTED: uncharacterized protein LOC104827634 [Tarenaya hassleriana]|uniref:uncharacterized protein LOC104827634 n=1 Tax=Tarenaya hassleriana TaxID=28532 RepID=UPI00053C2215|nr:PREDICTED: uncharacterized protein LOC104827634 [Tarenaya hassleriana]
MMFGLGTGAVSRIVLLLVLTAAVISPVLGSSDGGDDERNRRRDPLKSFRYYNGGFDVRNKHYWSSAAFTGVHGYVVAGVWSLSGVCFGLLLAFNVTRGRVASVLQSTRRRLDHCYVPLFSLVLLFVLLSMAATGMVIAANQSSRSRLQKLENTIANAGEDVHRTIGTVVESMTKIQYLLLPYDQQTTKLLNITTHRLAKESRIIQRFVHENKRSINLAIQTSYASHLMVASINLFLLFLTFALLLLHWHPGFIIFIFFCWILTTLFWVLTGFDFFLHTFSDDVCLTIKGFMQNPQNNTLSSILPCMDRLHSDKTLEDISLAIHNFISELNSKIAETMRSYALHDQDTVLPESGLICDPFLGTQNYTYIPQDCPIGAIPIGEFPNILGRFTCHAGDPPETCRTNGKFVPEASYRKAWAYSNAVQGMLDIFPDLQGLTRCLIIKDTFSAIVSDQCHPFRASMYRLWAFMVTLSVLMVVLVLLCVAKSFQEKGKSFSWFSIRPTSSQAHGVGDREQQSS